jgi:hypothetical protein
MPQSERSENIRKLLKWLSTMEKGASTAAVRYHVKWEVTEGGATDKTIKTYIEDLKKASYIEYKHPHWRITKAGLLWLERHSL